MQSSILVVDDDARLRALMVEFLARHGYETLSVNGGKALDEALQSRSFSLLILDVNMPGESGLEICQRLRNADDFTPIIMLTARSEDVDRIQGLEFGADDYVPKPFNALELLARIRAVLRRHAHVPITKPKPPPSVLAFDDFIFDGRLPRLTYRNQTVRLSPTELAILKILIEQRAQTVDRTTITQELHDREAFPDERTIDVFVSRIRKQLGLRSDGLPYIQTIRNKGYMFLEYPRHTES
jgi:two-component system phosphate regulon response regulator OmpR